MFVLSTYSQNTYLHCGQLIDAESGKILKEKPIIVSVNKIIAVENGYTNPKNTKHAVIDLKSKVVMPGLIDMHVHIEHETNSKSYLEKYTLNDADIAFNSVMYAELTLLNGFTTVRDLGGTGINVSLRNAINANKIKGLRVFTAEKAIATNGSHADPTNGSKKVS